jgi:hypothetical protein
VGLEFEFKREDKVRVVGLRSGKIKVTRINVVFKTGEMKEWTTESDSH